MAAENKSLCSDSCC